MSEDGGWLETTHLLSSPKNAERLLASVREVQAAGGEGRPGMERGLTKPLTRLRARFTSNGWNDHWHWRGFRDDDYVEAARDRDALATIVALVESIQRTPFEGLGNPEPLQGDLSGFWSRRIRGEHRLVYRAVENKGWRRPRVTIVQCRYHN